MSRIIPQFLGRLFLTTLLMWTGAALAQPASLADTLYQIISEQGIDAAVHQYQVLKQYESERYDFSEAQLNSLGYRLLGEGNKAAAIKIFKLNVKAYPKSPNVYDSLAEGFMRAGQTGQAIEYYEKVLAMLPEAPGDDQSKAFLKNNAQKKLEQLKNPVNPLEAVQVKNFLYASELPFGKLHPQAPPETEQFGQLAGIWKCVNFAYVNDQWFSGWPAIWVWKYILDGFAVQDLWYQAEANLPPTRANLKRDFVGTNLRMFDPQQQKWEIAWFTNTSVMTLLEAEYQDDQIVMKPKNPAAGPLRRVVFHNITADSFDWKSEISEDGGQTWTPQFRIEAKRVQ